MPPPRNRKRKEKMNDTLILVKNGKVQDTQIGLLSKDQLASLIDKNLN